ncbi:MAG: hypothetical protein J5643_05515 [Lachnospiraceae bacterium]|nr:hypothetical protein [Lachnospiraceae bacterium]
MDKDRLFSLITQIVQKNPYPGGADVLRQFESILKEQDAERELLDIVEKCAECFWETQEIVKETDGLNEDDIRRMIRRQEEYRRNLERGRC